MCYHQNTAEIHSDTSVDQTEQTSLHVIVLGIINSPHDGDWTEHTPALHTLICSK